MGDPAEDVVDVELASIDVDTSMIVNSRDIDSNHRKDGYKVDRSGSLKVNAPFMVVFGYKIMKNPCHPKRCRPPIQEGEVRPNIRNAIVELAKNNYFLILMIIMILLAVPDPHLGTSDGPLQTKYSVSYGVNIVVFFISGVTLKTETLVKALTGFKLNIFIQTWTFVIIPSLFYSIYLLLKHYNFQKELIDKLKL